MSEEDDPRQDQTTAGGPDGVPLGWRQRGRRRCQRADIQWTLLNATKLRVDEGATRQEVVTDCRIRYRATTNA